MKTGKSKRDPSSDSALKPPTLDDLEQTLGYHFRDRVKLERALTHRSWAYEQVGHNEEAQARDLHNESLEFLGDSVLGLVAAQYLCEKHPSLSEGELSRMKHRLVSTQTLAKASTKLNLGAYLRIGVGEEKSGGRKKRGLLADVFEAVLAAVYLDGGTDEAFGFVHRALSEELEAADPEAAAAADFKTALQERLQANGGSTPQYNVLDTTGPAHRRTFYVEVNWETGSARGEGRSIKAAESVAASKAIEQLGDVPSVQVTGDA